MNYDIIDNFIPWFAPRNLIVYIHIIKVNICNLLYIILHLIIYLYLKAIFLVLIFKDHRTNEV